MQECKGTQVAAARRLGINRNTLHKKVDLYRRLDGEGPEQDHSREVENNGTSLPNLSGPPHQKPLEKQPVESEESDNGG